MDVLESKGSGSLQRMVRCEDLTEQDSGRLITAAVEEC